MVAPSFRDCIVKQQELVENISVRKCDHLRLKELRSNTSRGVSQTAELSLPIFTSEMSITAENLPLPRRGDKK